MRTTRRALAGAASPGATHGSSTCVGARARSTSRMRRPSRRACNSRALHRLPCARHIPDSSQIGPVELPSSIVPALLTTASGSDRASTLGQNTDLEHHCTIAALYLAYSHTMILSDEPEELRTLILSKTVDFLRYVPLANATSSETHRAVHTPEYDSIRSARPRANVHYLTVPRRGS